MQWLHGVAWCCMVLHGVAWCCMVLHGVARCCMVLHGVASVLHITSNIRVPHRCAPSTLGRCVWCWDRKSQKTSWWVLITIISILIIITTTKKTTLITIIIIIIINQIYKAPKQTTEACKCCSTIH